MSFFDNASSWGTELPIGGEIWDRRMTMSRWGKCKLQVIEGTFDLPLHCFYHMRIDFRCPDA